MKPSTGYRHGSVTIVRQLVFNNPAARLGCCARRRRSAGRIGGKCYPWSMPCVCGDAKIKMVRSSGVQIVGGVHNPGNLNPGEIRFCVLWRMVEDRQNSYCGGVPNSPAQCLFSSISTLVRSRAAHKHRERRPARTPLLMGGQGLTIVAFAIPIWG
jgi:hypothetical protein